MATKSKSLGFGFAKFLGIAEYCERIIKDEKQQVDARFMGDVMDQIFGQVYTMEPDAAMPFVTDLINRWGNMAGEVRKSFKFRVDGWNEDIPMEGPFRMPFEFCTLLIELNDCDVVMFVDERIQPHHDEEELKAKGGGAEKESTGEAIEMDEAYRRMGMGPGMPFYSITIGQFNKDPERQEGTGIYPIEVHVPMDAPMGPDIPVMYAYPVPRSIDPSSLDTYANVALVMVERFLNILNHRAASTSVSVPGLKPGVAHGPRRKQKYRHFEYTTVTIDPNYVPEQGVGRAGGKHRLHPVRGFWRRYKSGKVVWVKAHWRGDKDLGVIHHDYEVKS